MQGVVEGCWRLGKGLGWSWGGNGWAGVEDFDTSRLDRNCSENYSSAPMPDGLTERQ